MQYLPERARTEVAVSGLKRQNTDCRIRARAPEHRLKYLGERVRAQVAVSGPDMKSTG